jgi:hypothetical protein
LRCESIHFCSRETWAEKQRFVVGRIIARVHFNSQRFLRRLLADYRLPANYAASQVKAQINAVQKEIGQKKKASLQGPGKRTPKKRLSGLQWLRLTLCRQAKEDATEPLQKKADLEKEHKRLVESAAEKDKSLKEKVNTIGNLVHDSVPVSDNEVSRRASVRGENRTGHRS